MIYRNKYYSNIYQLQVAQGWPGITKEVQEICCTLGLPDVTKHYLSRKEVVECIECYSMKLAKYKMVGKEKYCHILNQNFRKIQQYMLNKSLFYSRSKFF